MSYNLNNRILERETKYLDQRIKNTDLYKLCRANYVNQNKYLCGFSVLSDNCIVFKEKRRKIDNLNVCHNLFHKSVILMKDNYCLTYDEKREFNSKNNIVNLNIVSEFILGEKIIVNAEKKNYGVLFSSSHQVYSDLGYQDYAKIPLISLSSFDLIPFDVVYDGCHSETIEVFEEYYSGTLYIK